MRFEHDGLSLGFDDLGGAERPTVVLLHGLGDDRSTWRPFVPALSAIHRILTLDFRGHGESSHAPGTYTLEHYVGDALALCDRFLDQPAAMVGHSLGGVVALTVAQRRSELVSALFLEDPPLYPDEEMVAAAFFSLLRDFTSDLQARGAPVEEYAAVLAAVPSRTGRGTFAEVLGEEGTWGRAVGLAGIDPDVFLPAIEGTGLAGARPDLPVGCPTVVLRADPSLHAAFTADHERRFRGTNPHAEVRVVLGAGHLVHDEEPARFSAELERFLALVPSPTAGDGAPAGEALRPPA